MSSVTRSGTTRPGWPFAAVLAGAVLWGTTGTAQALAPSGASSLTLGALRAVIGAMALGLVIALGGARTRSRAGARGRRSTTALVVAGVSVAAYQLSFFNGVRLAGVAIGTLVGIGSAPVLTGLAEVLVRRRRPDAAWYAATALAVAGAAFLSWPAGPVSVHPVGLALAVGAGGSYAVLTLASKQLLDDGWSPLEAMAAAFAIGAVLLSPILVGAGTTPGELAWVATPRGASVALWLGGGTTALAYLLYARGLRGLEPPTVATLTLAEPLTAAALGVVVLGERPAGTAVIGSGLVVAGLVLAIAAPLLRSGRTSSPSGAPAKRPRPAPTDPHASG